MVHCGHGRNLFLRLISIAASLSGRQKRTIPMSLNWRSCLDALRQVWLANWGILVRLTLSCRDSTSADSPMLASLMPRFGTSSTATGIDLFWKRTDYEPNLEAMLSCGMRSAPKSRFLMAHQRRTSVRKTRIHQAFFRDAILSSYEGDLLYHWPTNPGVPCRKPHCPVECVRTAPNGPSQWTLPERHV